MFCWINVSFSDYHLVFLLRWHTCYVSTKLNIANSCSHNYHLFRLNMCTPIYTCMCVCVCVCVCVYNLMKLWAISCRATQEWQVMNLQMYKLGFDEEEELEIKLWAFIGSWRKQGSSRKTSVSLTTLKSMTVWITTNCGKFLKRWEYPTTLPVSWDTCMQVKKQQLGPDME